MGTIYTISPFINANSIPRRATITGVVSEHFYLFNVYSRNPYLVKAYMDFIDINFDYVFTKLGYKIVSYDYPDELDDDDSDIIEYINVKYDLTGDCRLDRCYQMNKETVTDLVTGKDIDLYFNDYAYYDTGMLGFSILSDAETDVPDLLLDELKYLTNKTIRDSLKQVIFQFMDYHSQLDYLANGAIEYYDSDIISNALLTLCQLKSYIFQLVKERGD